MSLAVLMSQHASPAVLAACFALLLVLSLVAVEEAELKRSHVSKRGKSRD